MLTLDDLKVEQQRLGIKIDCRILTKASCQMIQFLILSNHQMLHIFLLSHIYNNILNPQKSLGP